MSRYNLVFKGELAADASRGQCLERLSKEFKKDPEVLEKTLFSGVRVVVKRTSQDSDVERFQKVFDEAGAVLVIEDTWAEPEEVPLEDRETRQRGVVDENAPKPERRRRRRRRR